MSKIKIEIDGQQLEVEPGSTIIQAADAAGIYIPRFCYHKKLSVAANCRMCLVDVEKAPKPLPACATPVTDGMKVQTHSARAVTAQKGVMEFLLINHPLDCPVCDQGGECQLQDLAVGYGGDVSRYQEAKRIVKDKDLGPLIATDMTRCIHCTRCVRFGDELAGVMELGGTGRGEHTRIGTYVERTVDSELSGNMIDLCPVGALTSKPFRYSARPWELTDHPGISPHDCVGANISVQVRRNQVMRVLPRENEDVNEEWLADRDRFSYEAVNGADRLVKPMVRDARGWRETDWPTALAAAVQGMKKVIGAHGASQVGALAAPGSTVEEFYLLQKLVRALGSGNVDHRQRQRDFRDDAVLPAFPALGTAIRDLDALDGALLIGSNIRKDQPLLGLRLRKAALRGAQLFAVNPVDYEFTFDVAAKAIVSPAAMVATLARIAHALAVATGGRVPTEVAALAGGEANAAERAIADGLKNSKNAAVLLGSFAHMHPEAAQLRALADLIAELSGARLGFLPEADSAGAWLAGCVPHRGTGGGAAPGGRNAYAMLETPLKGYFLFGLEPNLDCWDGQLAQRALVQAEFVVAFSAFRSSALERANVLLPITPFTETEGTYVNAEGRFQGAEAAVTPRGEARPGWKVLRVLGNQFGLDGFNYQTAAEVLAEVPRAQGVSARLSSRHFVPAAAVNGVMRVAELPMYTIDPVVRRAEALQHTRDNPGAMIRMNGQEAQRQGVAASTRVRVISNGEAVTLDLLIDSRVPDGCVVIPAGYAETVPLGGMAAVRLEVA